MTTSRNNGKANGATGGGLTGTTERSYRAFVDGAFAVQEQYAGLMLGWMVYGPFGGTLAEGAETNRRAVEALTQRSMRQWEASQTLASEVFKAYASLFEVPGRAASPDAPDGRESGSEEPGLPIEDYDRLNVEEVGSRLGGLNALEVEEIKAHEKRNKNRATLLERLDRSLV